MSTWSTLHTDPIDQINRRKYHEIGREVLDIYRELQQADRPLAAKELSASIYLSKRQVNRRLDHLIINGNVRRREDGPNHRISYFEPIDTVHYCNGVCWEAKPVRGVNDGD